MICRASALSTCSYRIADVPLVVPSPRHETTPSAKGLGPSRGSPRSHAAGVVRRALRLGLRHLEVGAVVSARRRVLSAGGLVEHGGSAQREASKRLSSAEPGTTRVPTAEERDQGVAMAPAAGTSERGQRGGGGGSILRGSPCACEGASRLGNVHLGQARTVSPRCSRAPAEKHRGRTQAPPPFPPSRPGPLVTALLSALLLASAAQPRPAVGVCALLGRAPCSHGLSGSL